MMFRRTTFSFGIPRPGGKCDGAMNYFVDWRREGHAECLDRVAERSSAQYQQRNVDVNQNSENIDDSRNKRVAHHCGIPSKFFENQR